QGLEILQPIIKTEPLNVLTAVGPHIQRADVIREFNRVYSLKRAENIGCIDAYAEIFRNLDAISDIRFGGTAGTGIHGSDGGGVNHTWDGIAEADVRERHDAETDSARTAQGNAKVDMAERKIVGILGEVIFT